MSERIEPGNIGTIRFSEPKNDDGKRGLRMARASLRLEWGSPTVDVQGSGTTKLKAEGRLKSNAKRRYEKHLASLTASKEAAKPKRLADIIDHWNDEAVQRQYPLPQTQEEYYRVARTALLPALGDELLTELSGGKVNRALLGMITADGLGRRRGDSKAKSARTVLSLILDWAVTEDLVHRNVVRGTKPPKRPPSAPGRQARKLSPAEISLALSAVHEYDRRGQDPHRPGKKPATYLETGLRILLGTGIRIGELMALRWGCYRPASDGQPAMILINATVIPKPRRGTAKDRLQPWPKTDASNRILIVGPSVSAAIEAMAGDTPHDAEELMFPSPRDEGPFTPNGFRNALSNGLAKNAPQLCPQQPGEVGMIIPHAFRHTAATHITDRLVIHAAALALGHGEGLTADQRSRALGQAIAGVTSKHYVDWGSLSPVDVRVLEELMPGNESPSASVPDLRWTAAAKIGVPAHRPHGRPRAQRAVTHA